MKKMVLLVALFTLVAFASGVMAQTTRPAPATKVERQAVDIFKFGGVIEKVDQKAKTITVRGKVEEREALKSKMELQEKVMTFVINDKTKITSTGKTIDKKVFYNPKPGTRCLVDYFIPPKSGKTTPLNPVAVEIEYSTPKLPPVK